MGSSALGIKDKESMTSQPIEKFKEYIETQKDDFLRDGRRVEGIIRDIFPENKPLISLLMCAWKAGVVKKLRQTTILEVTIVQFSDRLSEEYSLRESSALTAVRMWAYALGVTDVVPSICDSNTSSFISQSSITTDTKKCPFCAEEVKKDARKCKRCHSDISKGAMVNRVQNNELVRQQEVLDRGKQKLEQERQEINETAVSKKSRKWRLELIPEENRKWLIIKLFILLGILSIPVWLIFLIIKYGS